jgi:hypothetical protein
MRTFPFVVHTTKLLLGLALLAGLFSCGAAEHQASNKINVQRDEIGPENSLYQHHDIMLELHHPGEIFGDVEAEVIQLNSTDARKFDLGTQDPVPASAKKTPKAKTPKAETPLPDDQLWRKRVYVEVNRQRQLVFDRAGIKPKLRATRPAGMGAKRVPSRTCQKPLRHRALTRLDANGKVLRSFRKPGSVN